MDFLDFVPWIIGAAVVFSVVIALIGGVDSSPTSSSSSSLSGGIFEESSLTSMEKSFASKVADMDHRYGASVPEDD